MNKLNLLVTVSLAFSAPAFAGTTDSLNYIDGAGKRQGKWIIYGRMQQDRSYANESKVEEGVYRESLKTGLWMAYFPDGKKKTEFVYVNNRPNGHAVVYNANGTKAEEGTWVGTRWVGDYHLYYEDGTERQSFNYNALGQRDGRQVYKHPNGKLAIEVSMKAGKEDGWKKEYDENGNLVRETFFSNGTIDPAKTKEYKTAAPAKAPEDPSLDKTPPPVAPPDMKPPSGTFNGEGFWTLYKNGQVSMKGTFHLKKLIDGEERIYDNNGMLVQIRLFRAGKYIGDAPVPADANK
jgi:antitoxin component YwqK of YwqJK toxin-antitoxin module